MSGAGSRYSPYASSIHDLAPTSAADGRRIAFSVASGDRSLPGCHPPVAGWHQTPAHQASFHQLEVAFWFMEQDKTVKSVILNGQNKVNPPPQPEPKEASRDLPQAHPNRPGPRSVPPRALNRLPVCQSKQAPRGLGRRLPGTQRTGDFFSLDVPLGEACQDVCQGICQGVQSAPTLWIHR